MAYYDVDPGDETRRYGDYIPAEHDEATHGYEPGDFVSLNDDGVLVPVDHADANGVLGVLYTLPPLNNRNRDVYSVDQDKPAGVKVQGTVLAHVDAATSQGPLTLTDSAAANVDTGFYVTEEPVEIDGEYYTEVLLR